MVCGPPSPCHTPPISFPGDMEPSLSPGPADFPDEGFLFSSPLLRLFSCLPFWKWRIRVVDRRSPFSFSEGFFYVGDVSLMFHSLEREFPAPPPSGLPFSGVRGSMTAPPAPVRCQHPIPRNATPLLPAKSPSCEPVVRLKFSCVLFLVRRPSRFRRTPFLLLQSSFSFLHTHGRSILHPFLLKEKVDVSFLKPSPFPPSPRLDGEKHASPGNRVPSRGRKGSLLTGVRFIFLPLLRTLPSPLPSFSRPDFSFFGRKG